MEGSMYQRYTLDKGINTSGTVSFVVEGHNEGFIDMSDCYLKSKLRVVKADGSALPPEARVYLSPGYGRNLWSRAEVALNNTPIPPTNEYALTTRVVELLSCGGDWRATVGAPLGETDTSYNSSSQVVFVETHKEMDIMAVAGSKEVVTYTAVGSDFMRSCTQLLPNNMDLRLTLTKARDSTILCSSEAGADYKVEIVSCSLFVRRLFPNPRGLAILNENLANGGELRYQRLHTVALPCAKGSRSWTWHNCFNGKAPARAFCFLLSQEAYFGSFSRISDFFESASVAAVRFQLDGRDILPEPYSTSYGYDASGQIDESNTNALSAFHGIRKVLGDFGGHGKDMGMGYSEFIKGCTLYAVDLEHSIVAKPVSGSFTVQIDFATSLSEACMIVIVGEFAKSLAFDANRSIVVA